MCVVECGSAVPSEFSKRNSLAYKTSEKNRLLTQGFLIICKFIKCHRTVLLHPTSRTVCQEWRCAPAVYRWGSGAGKALLDDSGWPWRSAHFVPRVSLCVLGWWVVWNLRLEGEGKVVQNRESIHFGACAGLSICEWESCVCRLCINSSLVAKPRALSPWSAAASQVSSLGLHRGLLEP